MKFLKILFVSLLFLLLPSGCSSIPKTEQFVGPVPPEPTVIRTRLVVHYKEQQIMKDMFDVDLSWAFKEPIVDLSEINIWFAISQESLKSLNIKFKIVQAVFLEYDDTTDFEDIQLDSDQTPDILSVYVLDETEAQSHNTTLANMMGMAPMGQFGAIQLANYVLLMPHRRGFDGWVFAHEIGHVLGNLEHTFKMDEETGTMIGEVECPDVKVTDNPFYCNIMNYAVACKNREFTFDQLEKFGRSLYKYQSLKIINYDKPNHRSTSQDEN